MDGLDVASVRFHQNAPAHGPAILRPLPRLAYPDAMKEALWNVMILDAEQLARLDHEWGVWVGREVQSWLSAQRLSSPDVVGSHGHTVFHKPDGGLDDADWKWRGASRRTEGPVVCDLRRLDMAFGGQGAPLVPLADEVLFGEWDVALNLGGFANLSIQRPEHGRVAWDVGAANLLLNMLAQTRGLEMDRDGNLARQGVLIPELMAQWSPCLITKTHRRRVWVANGSRQTFGLSLQRALVLHSLEDVMATAVEYTAWSVVRDVPPGSSVLVTGGGAKNLVLLAAIRRLSEGQNHTYHVPDAALVDGKEALVFAWLGLLRWLGLPNALPSVTGACQPTCGGAIWGANAR